MRLLPLVLACTLTAAAQTTPAPAKPVDPKLHADAIKLVEVSGARKQVTDSLPQILADGKTSMMERCPTCSAEYVNEWVRRMGDQIKVEDFISVFADEYEKFFTDSEILQLIAFQQNAAASPPSVMPDSLKTKVVSVLPSLQRETLSRCSEIGAKLGSRIAAEIETEHPEYIKPAPPAQPKP